MNENMNNYNSAENANDAAEVNETASEAVIKADENKSPLTGLIDPESTAALYTLWFGLDYGSILTSYALYSTVEAMGKKCYLVQKKPELWGEHYADPENIAGKFIYKNCDILEVYSSEDEMNVLKDITTHIVGSDMVWDCRTVGEQAGKYYYLSDTERESDKRIAYGSSLGADYDIPVDRRNDYVVLLNKFKGVSVKSLSESMALSEMFYIQPDIVLDPVFLCDKSRYIRAAESSVAAEVEKEKSFIFTYMKNGNERKRQFVLRGNMILLEKYHSLLRNFIDINRYPESKAAIGLEPAYHILTEDWLFYMINSDFVITDDYYGMCFAIMFEKNFAVVLDPDKADISMYTTLLEYLGLSERLVMTDEDFKAKEYLFRKPVRYSKVNVKLEELRKDSYNWLSEMLAD